MDAIGGYWRVEVDSGRWAEDKSKLGGQIRGYSLFVSVWSPTTPMMTLFGASACL